MFSIDKPAENISELINFLRNDSQHKYLFRGQIKEYPILVPSGLRKYIQGVSEDLQYIFVKPREERDLLNTDRDKIRWDARIFFMSAFGKGIGNLISQQYGISSESIDFTLDPTVAAFFATHKFPQYNLFPGSNANPIGIIYRMPNWELGMDIDCFEKTLRMCGVSVTKDNFPDLVDKVGIIWFNERFSLEHLIQTGNLYKIREIIEKYFGNKDHLEVYISTTAVKMGYSDLLNILNKKFSEMSLDIPMESSRLVRQKACLFFPPFVHEAYIPSKFKLMTGLNSNEYISDPPYALTTKLIAISNLAIHPDVEKFYFKHSETQIFQCDPSYYWPDEYKDALLANVNYMVGETCKKYLTDKEVDIFDRDSGIIEKGYYL